MAAALPTIGLLSLVLGGCVEPAQGVGTAPAAITGGGADVGHPSVIQLEVGLSGSVTLCSGTLVAPRTVVTAAHCLQPGQRHRVRAAGLAYEATAVARHDAWTAQGGQLNDIGVLVLADAPSLAIAPIAASAPTVGAPVTLVGFGIGADGQDDRAKRSADNRIDSLYEGWFSIVGAANACEGDSGGPVFTTVDGHDEQLGVISSGVDPCGTLSAAVRLDAYLPWIVANAAPDDRVGAACEQASDCLGRVCVVTRSDRFCSQRCATKDDCPVGAACAPLGPHDVCMPLSYRSGHAQVVEQAPALVGGCSVGARRGGAPPAPLLLLVFALLLLQRRRAGR